MYGKVLRVVYIDPEVDDYIHEWSSATNKPKSTLLERLLLLGMKVSHALDPTKQPVQRRRVPSAAGHSRPARITALNSQGRSIRR